MGLTHNLSMDPSQDKQWSHLTLIDLHCLLTTPHWIDEDKETLGPCNTWSRRKGHVNGCRMRSKYHLVQHLDSLSSQSTPQECMKKELSLSSLTICIHKNSAAEQGRSN